MGDLKEIKQWRKKASPHIFALEPRMLFDGVSPIDAQTNDSKSLDLTTQDISHIDSTILNGDHSITTSSQLNVLGDVNLSIPALIDWQNALTNSQKSFIDFLNSDQYLLTLSQIFKSQDLDLNTFNERAESIKQSLLSTGLNAQIELRSSTELQGYLAAYHFDEETGQDHIYVNRDWIEFGIGQEMIHRAILEEMGHAFDHHLNGAIDSLGDEGEYFSRILTNDFLSADEINRIKNENDHSQILIDGKYIDVEFASLNFTKGYIGTTSDYSTEGNTYTAESNNIYIKTAIATGSFTFTSANPADVTFSGNNVAGQLVYYLDGNKYTINGVFSRPDKSGSTPIGLYFVETTVLGANGKTLSSGGGSSTGRGFFFVIPSHESSYITTSGLNVRTSSDSVSDALNTADTAQNSNVAPVISSNGAGATASISINENTTAVTTVTATDSNVGDTKTFVIYGGIDKSKFTIDGSTGVLTFISAPNAESPTDTNEDNIYEVGVMVYDSKGAYDTQDISVTVNDVDDITPTITSDGGGSSATISIPKNTSLVTTVVAADADLNDVLTFSLSGTNASLFQIGTTTGVLEFKTAPTSSGTYSVTVTVTDIASKTDTQALTINVTDVDAVSPTLTITSSNSNLSAGEVCTIYFNFSEQIKNFTLSDVTVTGGTLTNLYQDPSDLTLYQATFTQSGNSAAPTFNVATNSYQDLANNNGSAASLTLSYDVIAPTVSVNIDGTDIAYKQSKIVTFTFSEDPENTFSINDISVTNGVISNLLQSTSDPKIWTATLQATSASSGPTVSVTNQSYSDSAGNLGSSGSDSATLAAPSIDLQNTATSDTGYSSSDNITQNRKPVIEGKAPANSSVKVIVTGSDSKVYTYNSVTVDSSGYWSIDLAARTASSISAGATALTAGGNLAEGYVGLQIIVGTNPDTDPTASSNFLIDLTAPTRPTVVSQTNISDRTPTITGTATVNSDEFLTVIVNGITYTAGDGNLSISGTSWTLTIPPENELPSTNTTYDITATVTDSAGNATSDNSSGELVMNFGSLVAPVVDLDPTNNSTLNNSATFTEGNVLHAFFNETGTNISDTDSTTLAFLKISITSSTTQARDYLVLDSIYIPIDVTGASGTVYYDSTYFSYLVSDSGGNRYITFTSQNATNSADLAASKASYETLLDALAFTNEGSSFTNGSTRVFSVIANDGTLDSGAATFTVTMARLNSAPTVTSSSSATFAENASGTVYTVTGTDPDAGTILSYSISGTDASLYNINSSTGAITFKVSPNYESPSDSGTNNVYDITVTASDGSLTNSQAVTITVTNLDEVAPTITSGSTASAIAENSGSGQVIYTVTSTDTTDYVSGSTTYSLSGTDASLFTINSSTGAVTLTANPNYETKSSYSFNVVATDAAGNASSKAVTLAITNVDEIAPAFTSATTGTALENQNQLYTAAANDTVDYTNGTVTYSLKSGTGDVASLNIDSSSGVVTLKSGNLDYETKSSYSFTVIAADATGNTREQAVTITVTNLDEVAPTITSGSTASAIAENSGSGQVIYTVTSTDTTDYVSGSTTYSLSGTDASLFTINSSTGAVTLTANPNYETKSSYSFNVVATDAAGNASSKAVTLAITNVDEIAPAFTSATTGTALENQNQLYTAAANDTVDYTNGTVTYSLKSGTGDVASLNIDSSSGVVTLKSGNLDYETKSSYSFTVIAADATGNTREQAVTITVTNLDEVAPTITSGSTASAIAENSGSGQVIYTVTSTDTTDYVSGSTTYSLSGTDASLFTINSSTGAVTLTANPNYETKSSYSFNVVATDAAGNASSKAVTLAITNVNDPPVIVDATINLDEKSINGYEVYDVNTIGGMSNDTDADGQSVTYSIQSGNDLGVFAIDASSGKISVIDATKLDSKTTPTFNLVVRASDGTLTDNATITINVSSMNNNLTFLTRNMPPPGMGPKKEVSKAEENETEIETNKLSEDPEEVSIAIKPHFVKPTLVNTQLKNSVKPLKIASPEMPIKDSVKSDNNNAQQQNALNQKNETGLRNTLTPPDAMTDHKGHVTYKLPEGTFSNGHGAVSMIAVQKDGSPLPSWIKFDGVTGKISADVPKGVSAPLEIKIQATDSKGDKAETVFKIQPRVDKVSFVGKKSLSEQFKSAFDLVA